MSFRSFSRDAINLCLGNPKIEKLLYISCDLSGEKFKNLKKMRHERNIARTPANI